MMKMTKSAAAMVGSVDAEPSIERAIAAIEQTLADWDVPGVVVGLTDQRKLRRIVVHGYADLKARTPSAPESRFAIGSTSKSFTAMALLQLAAEGRLDLHAPITRYLPSLTIPSPFAPISTHHLLTHTSGLPNYLLHAASSRYAMAALRDIPPVYAPGSHYAYSNTGYQVLGYLLEELDGVPYPRAIQRRILNPLGMASTSAVIDDAERSRMVTSYVQWPSDGTYVEAPWFEYAAGDGSMVSNARDMCAYARCILNRGMGPQGRLLSEADFAIWTTPVLDDYAYGLFVRQDNGCTLVGHPGGIAGFHSEFEVNLEAGFGFAMLSNSALPADLTKWLVEAITAAFRNTSLSVAPMRRPPGKIEDYPAVYHLASGTPEKIDLALECISQEGLLWLKHGEDLQRLERMGGDCFRVVGSDSDGFPFIFGRDEGGTRVTDVSHGARWYIREGAAELTAVSPPRDFAAYVGHFEHNGPEGPNWRFFVRNGRLWVKRSLHDDLKPLPLEPIGPNTFRLGQKDYSPDRVQFDTFIDGCALRVIRSGVPLYRKDTP